MPINLTTTGPRAADDFMAELADIFANFDAHRHDGMIQGMQRKWAMQRQNILGKPLPDLVAVNVMTGDTIRAKSAVGKILVMHFFGIDCEHCEDEMEWMRMLAEKYPKSLVVWGVSVDMGELDKVKEFVAKHNPVYPFVLPTDDTFRRLNRIYGGATPQTIVADRQGRVVEFFVGFNEPLMKRLEEMLNRLGVK